MWGRHRGREKKHTEWTMSRLWKGARDARSHHTCGAHCASDMRQVHAWLAELDTCVSTRLELGGQKCTRGSCKQGHAHKALNPVWIVAPWWVLCVCAFMSLIADAVHCRWRLDSISEGYGSIKLWFIQSMKESRVLHDLMWRKKCKSNGVPLGLARGRHHCC